ncbi:vegetative cell wall protein gp1-like [Trichoplusia ni]|uniref:Vegetative cell wall protein gp1-like n=1 Tax=Trichoplusia ni TaxID=7111 RepID=A0A7E5VH92_TRINI|nr:vegetative cell wall protein gp1-like [Trichoplusia ni]
MRVWGTALVLCAAACNAVCMSQNTGVSTEWAARWQNLVAEFLRNVPVPGGFSPAGQVPGTPAASAGLPAGGVAGGAVSWASWFPPPVPTLMHDQGGRSMPVLVLPIPVPMNQPTPPQTAQCALSPQPANSFNYDRTFNPVVINAAPAPVTTYSAQGSQPAYQAPFYPAPAPAYTAPAYPSPGPAPTYPTPAPYPNPVPAPSYPAAPAYPTPAYSPLPQYAPVKPDVSVPPPPKRRPSSRLPLPDQRLTSNAPTFPPVADSRVLLEQFRKQELRDSNLLPIVLHNREVQAARQRKTVKCVRRQWKGDVNEAPPPPPRFESSLYMRGRILAHRAGYTEPFSLWWDASSGASRMDFHNGTATTYRMKKRDGRVQSVQVRIDRTGETDVNRCRVMKPRLLTGAERALPALPDLQGFSYAGK